MKYHLFLLTLFSAVCPLSAQVTDIDGNTYRTVTVGNQVWMAENLRVGRLNNGTPLNLITDGETWKSTPSPAACWYNNDSVNNHIGLGRMYNGFAALNTAICPVGWKVPSDLEWGEMVSALGGANVAGGKMKDTGLTFWDIPNTGASNSSGFTGRGGGYRSPIDGSYSFIRQRGGWFVTQRGTSVAFRFLSWSLESTGSGAIDDYSGLSIRCLRERPASVSSGSVHMPLKVYPNPASGATLIDWGNIIHEGTIVVRSMDGRSLIEMTCRNAASAQLDISKLAPGIYVVNIVESGSIQGASRLVVH